MTSWGRCLASAWDQSFLTFVGKSKQQFNQRRVEKAGYYRNKIKMEDTYSAPSSSMKIFNEEFEWNGYLRASLLWELRKFRDDS